MVSAGTQAAGVHVLPPDHVRSKGHDLLARAYDLPCTLVLEVAAVDFTVGVLMDLRAGAIVKTTAQHNEDIMLKVNGQTVGLAEFDVVGDKLAVRLTGLA